MGVKEGHNVYTSYDPINLVWTDTVNAKGDDALIDKVDTEFTDSNWNDTADNLCPSWDMYVNISGTWTKQDKHFKDGKGNYCDQYHVRAWAVNDNLVIGSAHEEYMYTQLLGTKFDIKHNKGGTVTWDRNVFGLVHHVLNGFDSAEDEAAGEFSGSCWSVSKDSRNLNNSYTRTYYEKPLFGTTKQITSASNDGYATDILCS